MQARAHVMVNRLRVRAQLQLIGAWLMKSSKTMAEAEAEVQESPSDESRADKGPQSDPQSSQTEIVHLPDCVFCRIASKKTPTELLYEDGDYVCFVDRKPASTHHYLVIPRHHIRDPHSLTPEHVPLVEKMAEIGMQVLRERGGNTEEARIGFHWPPFVFVKHLHLHIVGPESNMGWLSRTIVFRKDSFAFYSPTRMIEYIRNKM